jgi:hypothetical protein
MSQQILELQHGVHVFTDDLFAVTAMLLTDCCKQGRPVCKVSGIYAV